MVEGRVQHISPDATDSADGRQDRRKDDQSVPNEGYRTLVAFATHMLERDGRNYKLSPGMQVNAEIRLGTRTILEYLLSPIQKVV